MKRKVIVFMPSIEGGGVEKNLIIVSNYVSKYIKNVSLITYDNSFNKYFHKRINIINVKSRSKKKTQNIINIFVVFGFYSKNIF